MKLRGICFNFLICIGLGGVEDLPKIDGTKLMVVPGPLVDDSRMDPSRWPGIVKGLDLRKMARRTSTIPAVAAPTIESMIEDKMNDQAGWKAYRFDIPPESSYEFTILAERKSWFSLRVVNKWGQIEEGMVQNLIQKGYPYANYFNRSTQTKIIYLIVDTTEDNIFGEPYALATRIIKNK